MALTGEDAIGYLLPIIKKSSTGIQDIKLNDDETAMVFTLANGNIFEVNLPTNANIEAALAKLDELDSDILGKFTYVDGELLYDKNGLVTKTDLENINPFASLNEDNVDEDFKIAWSDVSTSEQKGYSEEDINNALEDIWKD